MTLEELEVYGGRRVRIKASKAEPQKFLWIGSSVYNDSRDVPIIWSFEYPTTAIFVTRNYIRGLVTVSSKDLVTPGRTGGLEGATEAVDDTDFNNVV